MTNEIARPNFADMPIGKLREYASHMQLVLAKTATKDEIRQAIEKKLAGRSAAVLATKDGKVPPGHAKIIINEDATPGSKNFPIYMNVNGYQCTIPRGKEVIVPMRVLRTLNDAKVKRRSQIEVQDGYGRGVFRETTVTVPSYPFQVLEMVPGPEPLTPLEISKKKTMGPRRRYRAMFGHWPRGNELNRAIEKGLISLQDDEDLTAASAMLVGQEEDTPTQE
jgi:hypothetical protein